MADKPVSPNIAKPVSQDMDDDINTRQRVREACDRCRLKKSKCDGERFCRRCKQDGVLCRRQKAKLSSDDANGPKGKIHRLQEDNQLLRQGLEKMYDRMVDVGIWDGPNVERMQNGRPDINALIDAVGVLADMQDPPVNRRKEKDDELLADNDVLPKEANQLRNERKRMRSQSPETPSKKGGTSNQVTPPLESSAPTSGSLQASSSPGVYDTLDSTIDFPATPVNSSPSIPHNFALQPYTYPDQTSIPAVQNGQAQTAWSPQQSYHQDPSLGLQYLPHADPDRTLASDDTSAYENLPGYDGDMANEFESFF